MSCRTVSTSCLHMVESMNVTHSSDESCYGWFRYQFSIFWYAILALRYRTMLLPGALFKESRATLTCLYRTSGRFLHATIYD